MKLLCKIMLICSLVVFVGGELSDKTVFAEENKSQWETPSGIESDNIEQEFDEIFNNYIGKTVQGAAVAVVKNGKIVFEKGYGYADERNSIPVDPVSTVFEYGSVTKLFTWVSAMQLDEEGQLDLEQDIRTYLPSDFKVPSSYNKPITMLNLMNHTAGFDDYGIGLMTREDNYTNLRTALEEHKVLQMNEPGTICSYSNYGAGLAGYLVQCVASEDEYKYVNKHIFDVLDMKDVTMSFMNDYRRDLAERKSKGYETKKNGKFGEGEWSYIPMYPAGEGNGTVVDLAKFGIGLLNKNSGLFQSPETYDKLLSTTYTANEDIAGVAHGFFEYNGEYKTYWHNGGTNNFSTFFAVVPEADFAIAVVANTEGIPCNELVHKIGFMSVGEKQITLKQTETNLPSSKEVAGVYVAPRRCHHGIEQILHLLSMADKTVEYVDENEIRIDGEHYIQIKPYLYQNVEDGQKCYFTVRDGKVEQYTYIQGYMKVNTATKVRYYLSYGGILLGAIAFIVAIPVLIIALCKKRGKIYKYLFITEGLWIVLFGNIVALAIRALSGARFGEIRWQIVCNVFIGIAIAGSSILQTVRGIHEKNISKKAKVFLLAETIANVILLMVLINWGVFNIFA